MKHPIHSGMALWIVLSCIVTVSAKDKPFPEVIALPDGFQPEGVALGTGHTLFAGSLADGSVYQTDLRTGEGDILVPPQAGRIAVGLAFDQRSDYLFVAGGPAGTAYVYDAVTGEALAEYLLTDGPGFVNDVIVTHDAAYFTDSFQPLLYRLPLSADSPLPDPADVEVLELVGDFVFEPGAFNANGIESTPNGQQLIIVNSTVGELYRVDPATGETALIDLGGEKLVTGDGLVLEGRTLYVVQNRRNEIAVIELAPDLMAGAREQTLTNPRFDIPTTAAGFGNALYAVNARFGTPPMPDTSYSIVRVSK